MDNLLFENLINLGMAVLVGGIVGAEHEYRDKEAGCLIPIFSTSMDPGFTRTRIAALIVTGIGFLGASDIVREHGWVSRLTTTATIWLAAALGMGIGVVGWSSPRLEIWIDRIRKSRSYMLNYKDIREFVY